MNAIVRLYPRAWRARYGEELDDLASRTDLGMLGSIDLLRGALDAHRHPELIVAAPTEAVAVAAAPVSRRRYEDLKTARGFGRAAWVGAGLWLLGFFLAMNGPVASDLDGNYRDGAMGAPFIVLALILLSVGLAGQLMRLPRGHWVGRAGAGLAMLSGPVWGLMPWMLPIGAVACLGLGIYALAAISA